MKLKLKILVLVLFLGLHIFQMVRVTPNMQIFSREINDKCNINTLTSNNIWYSVMSGNLSFNIDQSYARQFKILTNGTTALGVY